MTHQLDRWKGGFGNDYIERNRYDWEKRLDAFTDIIPDSVTSILEVGSNIGNNVNTLSELGFCTIGAEPNPVAVREALKQDRPTVQADASKLPFPDNSFDLVFTCGVLMHIPQYQQAMDEIWRVTKGYALAIEYMGEDQIIPYHGFEDMLWKRPAYNYPGVEVKSGQLGREFDFCFYQLFRKDA